MNNNELKQLIDAEVNTNGHRGITGASLNGVLKSMCDVLGGGREYGGLADFDDEPEKDEHLFYVRTKKGQDIWQNPYLDISKDGIYILFWNEGVGRWMVSELITDKIAVVKIEGPEALGHYVSADNYQIIAGNHDKIRCIMVTVYPPGWQKAFELLFFVCQDDAHYIMLSSSPIYDEDEMELDVFFMKIEKAMGDEGHNYTIDRISTTGITVERIVE